MRDLTGAPAPPDRGPDPRRAARLLQRHRRPGAAARGPGARPAPGRGCARDRPARGRDRGGEGGLRPAHPARAGAAEGGPPARGRVDRGAADAPRAARAGSARRRRPRAARRTAAKADAERPPTPGRAAAQAAPAPPHPRLRAMSSSSALWPAVLERVRDSEGGEMLAALLADARPIALEDDVLVLSYPASASFSKRKIEDRANGERLAQALRLVSGRPLASRFEIHDGAGGHDDSGTPPGASPRTS